MHSIKRPNNNESPDHFKVYINQVLEDDFMGVLSSNQVTISQFLEGLNDEEWNYKYAPGKWSIKEIFIHIIDTERIFGYRALRVSRNDKTPIPGFEQDDYVPYFNDDKRNARSIIQEYNAVRSASLTLFKNLDDEALVRIGTASNNPISARALGFMIAGHEIHHMKVIHAKYLNHAK